VEGPNTQLVQHKCTLVYGPLIIQNSRNLDSVFFYFRMHVLCFEMGCYILLWARNIVTYQGALTQKNLTVQRISTYT